MRVFFDGAKSISVDDLNRVILIDKKSDDDVGLSNAKILELDRLKIARLYYDRGFFNVEIGDPQIEGAANGDLVDVHLPIAEGPQFRLGKLTIEERDETGKILEPIGAPLRSRVSLKEGEVVSRDALLADLEKIRTLYRDHGYGSVEAEPQTELLAQKGLLNVTIDIRRGDLTTIDRVLVYGNRHVPLDKIREALLVKDGDLFNETKILETKTRLLALGAFRSVDLSIEGRPSPTRSTLIFQVHEP